MPQSASEIVDSIAEELNLHDNEPLKVKDAKALIAKSMVKYSSSSKSVESMSRKLAQHF